MRPAAQPARAGRSAALHVHRCLPACWACWASVLGWPSRPGRVGPGCAAGQQKWLRVKAPCPSARRPPRSRSVNLRQQTLDAAGRNIASLKRDIERVKQTDAGRLRAEYQRLVEVGLGSGQGWGRWGWPPTPSPIHSFVHSFNRALYLSGSTFCPSTPHACSSRLPAGLLLHSGRGSGRMEGAPEPAPAPWITRWPPPAFRPSSTAVPSTPPPAGPGAAGRPA